jgi:hypothetical protein
MNKLSAMLLAWAGVSVLSAVAAGLVVSAEVRIERLEALGGMKSLGRCVPVRAAH